MSNMWILAQAPGTEAGTTVETTPLGQDQSTQTVTKDVNVPSPSAARKPSSPIQPMILFGVMAVIMYFLLFRGPRKKQQEHKQMLNKLQKNDRVRTIGGIIGTIIDIKDDEITLKVDESNNTKIKIIPSAIGRNMSIEK